MELRLINFGYNQEEKNHTADKKESILKKRNLKTKHKM